MTPRSYRMGKRADSTDETRRRIVEATLSLHTEKGIQATSWQDIAARADVAVGTVYYHFPTFDELIPACSGLGNELADPPTPAIFKGLRSKQKRIERLVEDLFAFYERSRRVMQNVLRDEGEIPALARVGAERRAQLRTLIQEALGPGLLDDEVALVEALLDFPVWLSLRERGIRKEVAVAVMTRLIRCAQRPT